MLSSAYACDEWSGQGPGLPGGWAKHLAVGPLGRLPCAARSGGWRGETRFVRCALAAQTVPAGQCLMPAARAAPAPALLSTRRYAQPSGSPGPCRTTGGGQRMNSSVPYNERCRKAASGPGCGGVASDAAEEHRRHGRARSAHQALTRGDCLNGASLLAK